MAILGPVLWMVGLAGAGWAGLAVFGGSKVNPEAGFAVAAPLVGTVGSWLVTARAHMSEPSKVTGVLIGAFGVKAVLFGAYVVGAVRGLGLRPVPFVVSFAGFFIVLYAIEALFLRRLFAGGRLVSGE